MVDLVLASLFFPLSHFLISSTPLRAMSVNLLGEKRYSLGYRRYRSDSDRVGRVYQGDRVRELLYHVRLR